MAKQFISEAQRMQKLAGILTESQYKSIDEMAIPEMARTAGTGGAYTITEKGEEILKQAKETGKAPEGIKNSEIAALVFLFKAKKDGKRVQKMDYAKERNVPQPAINPIFNSLEMKELVSKEGYTSKQQEPKTSRPRPDVGSMLGDLDIEEGKKPLKEDIFNDIDQDLMQGIDNDEDKIEYLKEVISYCQAKINEIESNLDESKKTLSEAKAGLFGKYIEFEKPEGPEVIVSFEKPNEEELGLDFGTLDEIMEIKEIDGLKLYFVYV